MRNLNAISVKASVALLSTTLLLFGCATVSGPPITEESTSVDLDAHGIALLGLTLSNTFRVSPLISPLETHGVVVISLMSTKKQERFFFEVGKPISRSDDDQRQVEDQMLSVKLPPGQYKLVCIDTTVAKVGFGCAPVCSDFTVVARKVAYLGHLDILRRERKNDSEPRAGFVLPFFDQWYSGFSTGTFDVAIRDNYEHDIPAFKQRYRVLSAYPVDNTLLPPLANRKFDVDQERCGE